VLATLEVVERDNLAATSRDNGSWFIERLKQIAAKHEKLCEVRGLGLMIGIKMKQIHIPVIGQLMPEAASKGSAELLAQHVALELLNKHRIITQVAANDFSVLKVMPPLIISRDELERFVLALDAVLGDSGHISAGASLAMELWRNRHGV
jgi:4-aminobutyrate aminotransferase-like enzyme